MSRGGGRGGRGGSAAPAQRGSVRDLLENLGRTDPGVDMKQLYGAMSEDRPRPLFPPAAFRRFPWEQDELAREEQFMTDEYRALLDDVAASPLNLDLVAALRDADNDAKSGAPQEAVYAARQAETTRLALERIEEIKYSVLFTREVFDVPVRTRRRTEPASRPGTKKRRLDDRRRTEIALGRLEARVAEGAGEEDEEDEEDDKKGVCLALACVWHGVRDCVA